MTDKDIMELRIYLEGLKAQNQPFDVSVNLQMFVFEDAQLFLFLEMLEKIGQLFANIVVIQLKSGKCGIARLQGIGIQACARMEFFHKISGRTSLDSTESDETEVDPFLSQQLEFFD